MLINSSIKLWQLVLSLVLLGFVFGIHAYWLLLDSSVPVGDAGDHFRISVLIYQQFQKSVLDGFMTFMSSGGKPILFSAYAVPVLSLVDMDPLIASKIFSWLIFTSSVLAFFWAVTFFVTNIQGSILSLIYGTLPFVFNLSTQFMPETAWQMWFWVFIATLLRSDYLKISRYSFFSGVSLGLCALCRPVESFVIFALPFFAYLVFICVKSNSRRYVFSLWLMVLIFSLLLSFSLLFNYYDARFLGLFFLVFFTLAVSALFFYSKGNSRRDGLSDGRLFSLFCFFAPLFYIGFLWMLFNGKALFFWATSNSFGEAAKINDQVYLGKNPFAILSDIVFAYGFIAFFILLLLALLKFVLYREFSRILILTAIILSTLVPMLLGYSITGTSDYRRIMVGILLAYFAIGAYLFDGSKSKFSNFALIILGIVGALQLVSLVSATFSERLGSAGILRYSPNINQSSKLFYPSPVKQQAVNMDAVDYLSHSVPSGSKIAVFSLGYFTPSDMAIEVESLRYSTLIKGVDLNFSTMWGYTKYEPFNEVINNLVKKDFDYVLIELTGNPFKGTPNEERMRSHTFFIEDFIKEFKQYGPNDIKGLAFVQKMPFDNKQIYLFKPESDQEEVLIKSNNHKNLESIKLLLDGEKSYGSYWEAQDEAGVTLFFSFTNEKNVYGVNLFSGPVCEDRMPLSLDVSLSSDGVKWSEPFVFQLEEWKPSEKRTLNFSGTFPVEFVKIYFPTSKLLRIYELDILHEQNSLSNYRSLVSDVSK